MGVVDVKIPMMESEVQDMRVINAKDFGCFVLEIPTSMSKSSLILFLPHNSSLSEVEQVFGNLPTSSSSPRVEPPPSPALETIINHLQNTTKTANVKVFMPRYVNIK